MRDRIVLATIMIIIGLLLAFIHLVVPVDKLFIVVFLMVVYTIMLELSFTHQSRKRKKRPQRLNYNYEPSVCIMIPAHNEETVIAQTIENVMALDYNDFEVMVIDDRSTDNTAQVLLDLEEKYDGKLKVLIRDKDAFPGKSAVLNDALKLSDKEVICVFDADAKVHNDFLKTLLPYLAPEDVGAVQARKIINNKDVNLLTRCQNNEYTLDSHFQLSRDSINGAVELRGNGFLVKRSALDEVGGWTNNTITDDLDLSTKLHLNAWGVRFCPQAEVYEEAIISFIPLLKQRRRWVEGSLRRYLDYFFEIVTSDIISLRVGFDMIAFLLEFIVPVILLFQLCLQSFYFIKSDDNQLISTLSVALGIGIFMFLGIVFSLRKYDKVSLFQAIKQSIETSLYMMFLWTPLVTLIVFKVLFGKRDMKWGKTSHGLAQESHKENIPVETKC
ncbi:MAG: glycosyltransferase family 2 protein [Candidatus Gastranaerophilales bacterium]|nr:glycosyltransferase family 2 protein [Candidatus Gastranaerophilales bacterium]